ncbi:MAG: polysaccharide deacetylase family protein, partial [Symploca sp. SIO1A3]|nr:polysaccharide deacetylase family protein [Symploca sp. SIO1A3]
MRIGGLGRLKRTTRQLRNRFAPGGLILLYHRVAEVPSDPFKLCVKPGNFAQQLEVLKKYSNPMPLQQLVQAVRDGKRPNRAVAVTFDDGYVDNLYEAKPLLERYDIPATVFVTTGNLGSQQEFWWDELERLLLQPGKLPTTLGLSIKGCSHQWDLGEAADYSEDNYQCDRTWNWYLKEDADPSPRQRIYRSLYQLLQPLLPDERQQLMSELLAWSGAEAKGRPTHYCLSTTEVSTLAKGGLIEVGAHTVKHPFLSALPPAVQ